LFPQLHSNIATYNTFIFINNVIINDKLIIILTPSDAGGNNESDGMKKSFSLKMRVTIVVSETDDMSAYNFGTSGNNLTKLFHVTCREV